MRLRDVCETSTTDIPRSGRELSDIQNISSPSSINSSNRSFQQNRVQRFLEKECPELISDDVMNNDSLVQGITCSLEVLEGFSSIHKTYSQTKKRTGRVTELSKALEIIEKKQRIFSKKLYDAASVKIDITAGTHVICVTSQKKLHLLTQAMLSAVELANTITKTQSITKMKKRIVQTKTEVAKVLQKVTAPSTTTKCFNTTLSWQVAYIQLETGVSAFKSHSHLELQQLAHQVEDDFFVDVRNLDVTSEKQKALVTSLLEHFPVMLLKRQDKMVLLNVQELILDPLSFDVLLQENSPNAEEQPTKPTESSTTAQLPLNGKKFGPENKRGRKPLSQKFPTLVKVATEFIKQHSFAAHGRRRETTGTGTGVSLEDIRQHLLATIPGLKEHGICKDTVHHLMVAPRAKTIRAERYKGIVDAKIPAKRNQYREGSENQHFLFARAA